MIEQCSQLVKLTKEGRRWKCVDHRLPEMFQGECTMSILVPRMIGGYVLNRVKDGNQVTVRLGGAANEAHPNREFQAIDIEYINIDTIEKDQE